MPSASASADTTQTPNTELQRPKKSQIPNPNPPRAVGRLLPSKPSERHQRQATSTVQPRRYYGKEPALPDARTTSWPGSPRLARRRWASFLGTSLTPECGRWSIQAPIERRSRESVEPPHTRLFRKCPGPPGSKPEWRTPPCTRSDSDRVVGPTR